MLNRILQKLNIQPKTKQNDSVSVPVPAKDNGDDGTRRLRRVVIGQAALAVLTLTVAIVVIFTATAAWYTNVSKVGTLKLQTQTWGFDRSRITVGLASDATASPAAPGMSGLVPLAVDNAGSSERLAVRITVSKSYDVGESHVEMPDQLKQRIYFYADSPAESNGEVVSRVWLGSTDNESYTYDIFPGRTLSVIDLYQNDVPIKWTWVYDMLGYYFRGTVSASGVDIGDYLRPIEYDLDSAVFAESGDDAGKLVTVGGIGITEDGGLLPTLSSSDGYPGALDLDPNSPGYSVVTYGGKTYYRISADDSGYGVWAYLCTLDEVRAGIDYDSSIGSGAQPVQTSATVNVTVDNVFAEPKTVSTEAGLRNALMTGTRYAVLGADVTLTSRIDVLAPGTVIDLGGHTLTYSTSEQQYSAFAIASGGSLTVLNGSVSGSTTTGGGTGSVNGVAFTTFGGWLTLRGVNVSNVDCAVAVLDSHELAASDSVIRISDGCTLTTLNPCVFVSGNGDATEGETKVIIDNSTLVSSYHIAVTGTDAADRWGTGVYITRSNLTGYYAALYQPQKNSNAVAVGSTLTASTAVVVKGGSVTLRNCGVTGNGAYAAAAESAVCTQTGGAVYVEAKNYYSASVVIDGSDSVIRSDNGHAVELFGKDAAGPGSVMINAGAFTLGEGNSNGVFGFNNKGSFVINGGVFPAGDLPEGVIRRGTQ